MFNICHREVHRGMESQISTINFKMEKNIGVEFTHFYVSVTPSRTPGISRLKSQISKPTFLS